MADKFEDELAHTIAAARSQGSLGQQREPDEHWSLYSGDSWTLRLGTFERCAGANPDGARRFVNIENCTIAKGGSIGDRKFFDEVFTITVDDHNGNSWRIGGFDTSRKHINLQLPPVVFDQVWTAAEKADGMWRRLSFGFKVENGRETEVIFPIIEATLIEGFAHEDMDIKYDDKTGLVRLVRPQRHPVLAGLQASLKGLISEMRIIRGLLFFIAGIGVVLAVHWLR